MSAVEVDDQVPMAKCLQHNRADPTRLKVHFAKILLPAAQVKHFKALRMIHDGLNHAWNLLHNIAGLLSQATFMGKVKFTDKSKLWFGSRLMLCRVQTLKVLLFILGFRSRDIGLLLLSCLELWLPLVTTTRCSCCSE